MEIGGLGGGRATRISDDQATTSGALRVEILHDRGHGFGGVGADQQDGVGTRDILEREGQAAVDSERPGPRCSPGSHAEAAIVVDIGGANREAGELAEHIGFLVGQAARAEHAHCIKSV